MDVPFINELVKTVNNLDCTKLHAILVNSRLVLKVERAYS